MGKLKSSLLVGGEAKKTYRLSVPGSSKGDDVDILFHNSLPVPRVTRHDLFCRALSAVVHEL